MYYEGIRNECDCLALNLRIISEAAQPFHLRLAPKPGHLPLDVITVRLLRRLHSLFTRDLSAQELRSLLVAQRPKRMRRATIFLHKRLGFFHQARAEHLLRPVIDTLV